MAYKEENLFTFEKTSGHFSVSLRTLFRWANNITPCTVRKIPSIRLGLDDSYLCKVEVVKDHSTDRNLFISCGRPGLVDLIDYLINNKTTIQNNFKNIFFWECYETVDEPSYQRVLKIFPETKKLSVNELLDNGITFKKTDFLITGRFHPHMIFARAGGCGSFISTNNYYHVKHKSILDKGSNFQQIPKANFNMSNNLLGDITSSLEYEKLKVAKEIYPFIY